LHRILNSIFLSVGASMQKNT